MSYSESLFQEARDYIPGGVNSPVRAFKAVGGTPLFISKASGAYIYDADDKQYIDYVGSWGPMILGHANPSVIEAVKQQAEKGLSYGAPCEIELRLVEKICELMPNIEKLRLVNSGTEATMTAIRLARGFTGRNKIVKFAGCYHGHSDSLLVNAGSGALTLGVPSSPGVPAATAAETLTANFNDLASVEKLFTQYGDDIAAIIIEPIAGNMNMILPQAGFLKALREMCDRYQSVLIFDEVMTGFRVALQGAQSLYNVKPDLTTLGKVIGGGMPVGALGGRADIMNHLAPEGSVYQAGTLSGNPLAAAAGLTTLNQLNQNEFYSELENKTRYLVEGIIQAAKENKVSMVGCFKGGMFGLFFTDQQKSVSSFAQATACNHPQFIAFFHAMLKKGVYLAPSSYEAGFVSAAHSEKDIQNTIDASREVFLSWQKS